MDRYNWTGTYTTPVPQYRSSGIPVEFLTEYRVALRVKRSLAACHQVARSPVASAIRQCGSGKAK